MGGVATKLIEKNTHIPTKKSQVFSTASDNQTSTMIRVSQGERPMFNDNKLLGEFNLDGIPPAPRGVPQIEVTFDVDSNGVLKVTAKDKTTGKEQSIRIEASSGLSKEEIDRMQKEAEDHAAEDAKKKELIEVRNTAEQLIYTAEKSLKDHEKDIPTDVKTEIEGKITAVKEVKDKDDKAAILTATEALSAALQKIGDIMSKAAEAATEKTGTPDEPTDNAPVRDADVKEDEAK